MSCYKKFDVRKRNPDPKSTALLVIDMQNIFSAIAEPIISSLQTTIDLCRSAGIPVIYTRHRHRSPEEGGMLGEWWGEEKLIFDGTHESELIAKVGPVEGELVVEKSTYGGFTGTDLEQKLQELGVKEVIVTGVMTNLCCETTAREAFVRGFRVFFSTDATATDSMELHHASLMNMAYGFAYLVDCNSLKHALLANSHVKSMEMMGMGFMAFVSVLLLSVMAASSYNLKEIRPQVSSNGVNRVGESTCSKNSISISQGPSSDGTYGVLIVNVCTTQCDVANVHVSCGAFSSSTFIDPKVFRRVNDNDCLVSDGQVIHSAETVSFKYSSDTQYPLSVSSLSC